MIIPSTLFEGAHDNENRNQWNFSRPLSHDPETAIRPNRHVTLSRIRGPRWITVSKGQAAQNLTSQSTGDRKQIA